MRENRERERERERAREREIEREGEGVREGGRERERERARASERAREILEVFAGSSVTCTLVLPHIKKEKKQKKENTWSIRGLENHIRARTPPH